MYRTGTLAATLSALIAVGCGDAPPGTGTGGQSGASGGAVGVGGTGTATGGVSGSGAAPGSGGAPATGGAQTSSGGALTGTGGDVVGSGGGGGGTVPGEITDISGKTIVACTLSVQSSELSPEISTVGIVEFSTDLAGATAAFVQFGKTADYSFEAAADLVQPEGADPYYRSVLLGMVTNLEHHYRVVVVSATEACVTEDQTITTGPMPNGGGIGNAEITPGTSTVPFEEGFIVNATYNSDWLYIVNHEGELVWYFPTPFANPTRARMSWDGKHMWLRDGNPGAAQNLGYIAKISMDGTSSTSVAVPTSHHDLTVLPDGSIAYIKLNPNGNCDAIYLHAGDGMDFDSDPMFFDIGTAFSGGSCHANSIHYHLADGSFTVSDLNHNAYVKVSADGELEWVLGGGESSDFSGEGASWERQHGHHLLAEDLLLFFNNGPMNTASPVKEVTLDFSDMSATFGFEYSSNACGGNCLSQFMGDVQRLPNGNTFVTYSSMGYAHEVDPSGMLIRSFDLPDNSAGYSEHRPTLYGPPPR